MSQLHISAVSSYYKMEWPGKRVSNGDLAETAPYSSATSVTPTPTAVAAATFISWLSYNNWVEVLLKLTLSSSYISQVSSLSPISSQHSVPSLATSFSL